MSVTATAVSAGPVVVKEKKTAIIFLKDVKTKIFKHHHHKHTNMSGRKGKKMAMKTGTGNNMPMKTGTGNNMPMKTGIGNSMPMKTGTGNNMPMNYWIDKDLTYIMDSWSRNTT